MLKGWDWDAQGFGMLMAQDAPGQGCLGTGTAPTSQLLHAGTKLTGAQQECTRAGSSAKAGPVPGAGGFGMLQQPIQSHLCTSQFAICSR